MMTAKTSSVLPAPPDQHQRLIALDPNRSVIVQAPAGSGKTDLLTRRFLRLLAEVDDPKQIVAITFTKAAAAEMRHRILDELDKASRQSPKDAPADDWSMEALAARALSHSRKLNWRLIELSSQLRISTIDSFCRDLAIQQPIHSGIGNNLQISERPAELYRMAARVTLEKLGDVHYAQLSNAISDLLLWRDNSWKELEDLLVRMLAQRDRWMLDFVLRREQDWDLLRERLERPMAKAVQFALERLEHLLTPDDRAEAHDLARFACAHGAAAKYRGLAELAEFPAGPYADHQALEDTRGAYLCLAGLLLKKDGEIRRKVDSRLGFPKEHLDEKLRIEDLLERLAELPGLEDALAQIHRLPPARYTEEDWQIIRASFLVLRHAVGELKTVFAETGTVDFTEVSQIAKQVLRGEDNLPSDAAQAVADDIHHLLVDEFQDTSRRQHEFVTALIEAWPDPADRTVFVVGDPMQSIYFFRDAEAELFRRVNDFGFELRDGESFPLDPVALSANFRTAPELVSDLNAKFAEIFAVPDGSGIEFAPAEPARATAAPSTRRFHLHLAFIPQTKAINSSDPDAAREKQEARAKRESIRKGQIGEIISLIGSRRDLIDAARAQRRKYRIAILGRARTALAPIASALREAGIPFRAVELESLRDRPEIHDAVSLTRALFNPEDRVAWLGVLRAPWCGLCLADLHNIAGTDQEDRITTTVPQLLRERLHTLSPESRNASERLLAAYASLPHLRAALPTASSGTLMQQLWRSLGGDACIDDAGRANLDLFWNLLDNLPNGEQDIAGPALDAALEDLCAMPDPAASCDYGVQLMTIHKSKGLEFEVVIVPDLQAQGGRGSVELLSWLERGLPEPGESGELTEFLIAPVQYKGADPGAAKRWVDRTRREREAQEMRRIIYVAATRAREQLHLFAQPAYKIQADGAETLVNPLNCLLATAWPALGDEIRTRFEQSRNAAQPPKASNELIIPALAAVGRGNVIVMPSRVKPTIVRRLPADFEIQGQDSIGRTQLEVIGLGERENYTRHEGGLLSRALGNAVHKLLEQLSRLRLTLDWDSSRVALGETRLHMIASIRSAGILSAEAEKLAARALEIAIQSSHDSLGQWILSPHAEAESESAWAGTLSGSLHQIRVDRLFRAGLRPLEPDGNTLWIIDYKTAHAEDLDTRSTIPSLRKLFAPQLETYANILRSLRQPDTPLRAGLYYPRMCVFDWWEI